MTPCCLCRVPTHCQSRGQKVRSWCSPRQQEKPNHSANMLAMMPEGQICSYRLYNLEIEILLLIAAPLQNQSAVKGP